MIPNKAKNDFKGMTHDEMCQWIGDLLAHYFHAPIREMEPLGVLSVLFMAETQLQWTQDTYVTVISTRDNGLGYLHRVFLTVAGKNEPETHLRLSDTQETFLWLNDIVSRIL